jgi:hypothetical protein
MGEFLLGCSGWNYPDTVDKGIALSAGERKGLENAQTN